MRKSEWWMLFVGLLVIILSAFLEPMAAIGLVAVLALGYAIYRQVEHDNRQHH